MGAGFVHNEAAVLIDMIKGTSCSNCIVLCNCCGMVDGTVCRFPQLMSVMTPSVTEHSEKVRFELMRGVHDLVLIGFF